MQVKIGIAAPQLPSLRSCARCGTGFRTVSKHYLCPGCRNSGRPRPRSANELSRREQQIVELIQQAKANKEIAFVLHLSEGTIKEYLHRIFRKLNVTNRTELALRSCQGSFAVPRNREIEQRAGMASMPV